MCYLYLNHNFSLVFLLRNAVDNGFTGSNKKEIKG